MPDVAYALTAVLVAGAVTVALRILPFALLRRETRESTLVRTLQTHLPAGLMVILAVYALTHLRRAAWPVGLPELLALGVTVALHLWRRHAVISILGGTLVYVVLVTLVAG